MYEKRLVLAILLPDNTRLTQAVLLLVRNIWAALSPFSVDVEIFARVWIIMVKYYLLQWLIICCETLAMCLVIVPISRPGKA